VNEAWTLPGTVYHDAQFHKIESERVWRSSWVAVAETTDISNPGDVIPVTVGGRAILLANDKGTIRAFHNVCRHRGAQLVTEKCEKRRTILCPYHRWGYALDGRCVGTPAFDEDEEGSKIPERLREKFRTHHVKNFDKADMGLYPIRCSLSMGMAFVNLDNEAPPLDEWRGDLLSETLPDYLDALENKLVVAIKKTYAPAANWKLLIENFLEYYHLPAVHPALCDVSGVDEHLRQQGKGMYMCFATHPLNQEGAPQTVLGPGRLPPFPGISGTNLVRPSPPASLLMCHLLGVSVIMAFTPLRVPSDVPVRRRTLPITYVSSRTYFSLSIRTTSCESLFNLMDPTARLSMQHCSHTKMPRSRP
jgi:choline monooxygenase